MTYLQARQAVRNLEKFRQLTIEYWEELEEIDYHGQGWMAGRGAPTHRETERSVPLRVELTEMLPEVQTWAARLGLNMTGHSYPAPIVGGPVLPFDFLAAVTNQWVGHSHIPRQEVLDSINRCIGAARLMRKTLGWRLVKPWCWLVDVPALIVGWPFAVMRKAGVSSSIVDGSGAQIAKVIFTGLLWLGLILAGIYRGDDIATALGRALDKIK